MSITPMEELFEVEASRLTLLERDAIEVSEYLAGEPHAVSVSEIVNANLPRWTELRVWRALLEAQVLGLVERIGRGYRVRGRV